LLKCIDYSGVKGSLSANKKIKFWIQQRSKEATKGPLVWEHRTVRCTPDSVRCTKEARPPELASLGNAQQPLRYNSPDMSGVHRTVRCNHGATATLAPTATCGAFNARCARAEVRHAHTGAPDNEQEMSGVHRTSRRAQKSEAPTVRIQRQ
jgi:hypothetical protein